MSRKAKRAERIRDNRTIRSVPRAKRCQRAIENHDWERAETLLKHMEHDSCDPPAVVYLRWALFLARHTAMEEGTEQ
jgi:hypothetical protein